MRLFIAVNFSDDIKKTLIASINKLKSLSQQGNFTLTENLHLTLVFIGETNDLSAVKESIDKITANSFELRIGNMGRFKRNDGDIYWVGVEKNQALSNIVQQLNQNLIRHGFNIESRDYRPHITIGRNVMAKEVIKFDVPQTSMTVRRISLMKSERINGKLTYTEIYGRDIL